MTLLMVWQLVVLFRQLGFLAKYSLDFSQYGAFDKQFDYFGSDRFEINSNLLGFFIGIFKN